MFGSTNINNQQFDYIIVGAGSAGCVLANRLSADGRYTVCILEAGGSDQRFWIQTPLGYGKTYADKNVNWMYTAAKSAALDDRTSYWPRGKVLGGSSSINAMVYIRGIPSDYDEWAAQGCSGWCWQEVLPYFKKSEQYSQGASSDRGGSGPLHVHNASEAYHPLCDTFFAAAAEMGIPKVEDFNTALGGSEEGVGHYQITAKNGRRMSASRAYLRPALRKHDSLTLQDNTLVTKIVFNGNTATGVEFESWGERGVVTARKEVIVAGGAVNSPQLLQLSGVGDTQHLAKFAVKSVVHNQNVGQHLQDHLAISHYYEATVPTLNNVLRPWWGKLAVGAQYLLTRTGPLAIGVNQAGGFVRSSSQREVPNLQLYFSPLTYTTDSADGERPVEPDVFPGFLNSVSQCRPKSTGSINIASADVRTPPLIEPNYLADEADQQELLEGVRLLRAMASSKALGAVIKSEKIPGSSVSDDEQMLRDIRRRADTVYHPTSTCRMGGDESRAVVDPNLRVYGTQNLRVVDASVFPTVPSGNINAQVIMLAERAADLIMHEK
ncbi:MAG: GMC family oxidoreductase [Pseudomonadales bacterium]